MLKFYLYILYILSIYYFKKTKYDVSFCIYQIIPYLCIGFRGNNKVTNIFHRVRASRLQPAYILLEINLIYRIEDKGNNENIKI